MLLKHIQRKSNKHTTIKGGLNKIFSGIFILLFMATASYGQQEVDNFPFSKIEQKDGLIRLQFPDQGVRWLMGLNTDKPVEFRLSNYSEIVELKVGDRLELTERHLKFVFEPIYQDKQIFLKKDVTTDSRSMGGTLKTERFLISVSLNEPVKEKNK